MHDSLWEQATESDWPEEERTQWYRERPADRSTTASSGSSCGTGFEGKSPLRLAEAEHYPLHVSLAFDDELTEQQKRDLEEEWAWSGRKPCTSTSSSAEPPASSPSSGTPWPTRRACSGPALPAPTATDRAHRF